MNRLKWKKSDIIRMSQKKLEGRKDKNHCAVLSHSVVSDCLWLSGLWPSRLLCLWLCLCLLQTRTLEWVAMLSSRGSSQPRDRTQVSSTEGGFFTIWAPRETPKPLQHIWPYSTLWYICKEMKTCAYKLWALLFIEPLFIIAKSRNNSNVHQLMNT